MATKKVLTHNGVAYRTQPFPKTKAFRFARLLEANSNFTEVWVLPSRREPDSFLVEFRPANEARQAENLRMAEQPRQERATSEKLNFWPTDNPNQFLCHSASGKSYYTSRGHCTCPDFEHRAGPAGISCKHIHGLEKFLKGRVK